MDIVFDLSPIYRFLSLPTDQMLLSMLFTVGWIPIAMVFLWGAKEIWMDYIQGKWGAKQKFILLAIDIPKENSQSPKAVENIFTYLAGAHGTKNLIETYWEGQFQLSISLEIVSIDGYTQFLIHTPAVFRNLVESGIYSQYPDAEITEVDDYTDNMPTSYPDEEYDVWGAEFEQSGPIAYPIKLYDEFVATQIAKPEDQFKDPVASLMDLCSSLKKGEQLWYQQIITPLDFKWVEAGSKEISSILGESVPATKNFVDKLVDLFMSILEYASELIYSLWGDIESRDDNKDDDSFTMMNLKPKEKKQIEAIQQKISKIGYGYKSRMVYIGKQDVMVKPKVVNGFVGYMKQFTDIDLNGIKPEMAITGTAGAYLFKDRRINVKKGKIVRNYIARSSSSGRTPGILNIEELATLWHFPIETAVKAPMIQKTPGRKSEPPMSLPFSEEVTSDVFFTNKEKDDIFKDVDDEQTEKNNIPVEDGAKRGTSQNGVVDISNVIFDNDSTGGDSELFDIEEMKEASSIPLKKDDKKNNNNKEEVKAKGTPPSNLPFA